MTTFPIIETNCTITSKDGEHSFTSGGAYFDLEKGGTLYAAWNHEGTNGPLETWHGEHVGTWFAINKYRNNFGATITSIRATIAGRDYYGRYGSDWSQLVNLRPCKASA